MSKSPFASHQKQAQHDGAASHRRATTTPTTILPTNSLIQRAQQNPSALSSHEVLTLQRTIGNRAVSSLVQRKVEGAVGEEGGEVSAATEQRIQRSQSGGNLMPQSIRNTLEPRLGADLSSVRLHTGSEAAQLSRDVGAKAFTTGNHIYYGSGESPSDLQLTAHEVVHTMQQGATPSLQRNAKGVIQRWPFGKKKRKSGTSFDNPKHYKDPKVLKSDRSKEVIGLMDSPLYPYNPDTGMVGDHAVDILSVDTPLGKTPTTKSRFLQDGTEQKGYLYGNDSWIPANYTNRLWYAASEEELFPKTGQYFLDIDDEDGFQERAERRLPTISDVRQAEIGDCWLEAALISIVHTDPEYIHGMMQDNGDTVTVRLYEVNRSNPKRLTFKPRFININKSTVRGSRSYQDGALWVSMIQKAYAASGFTGKGKHKTVTSKTRGKYAYIDESGNSSVAFETLLGRPSEGVAINSGMAQDNQNMKELPWSSAEIKKYKKRARPTQNYDGLVSYSEIFLDFGKVDRWMSWLQNSSNRKAIDEIFEQRRKTEYQREVRLEHLQELFETRGLDNELLPELLTYLGRFFPGKRGSGQYTDAQLDVYTKILEALESHKNVAASTHNVVGRESEGQGQSGGEDQVKGLVGTHGYAVIDTSMVDGIRYIKIQNPWGRYGRDYTDDNGTLHAVVKAEDDGQSDIELADFTRRFSYLHIANNSHSLD